MSVKLLAEHHLKFLSLKGCCTGSSESTLVKMPHCWKSHVTAKLVYFLIMPPSFIMGGGAYSITLVRTYVPYVQKIVFRAISFEYIIVLDSYFIHRYINIKYWSSSITDKIHQLLSELWPLISVRKMVSRRYLLNTMVNWIHISYKGI